MNRKMIAWFALVIFCVVGVVASTVALNHYSFLLSTLLTIVFGVGLVICVKCLDAATWDYCVKKGKEKNG
ncbi:hypothetical protein MPK70_gp271 [Erwinia phage pEa_SNUABM_33]|uniref:Uncharacterized protein n=1 Tax=Erwinia phage pEa_SNUABM_33 TaxID=2869556 RepID=A0AAE7XKW0_9CAUD|nr:hypothetical protein MPK70_gp271 [Erwinia phage pEa_SNUABM_33]QZE58147.1 hypothetical protein pEaSNUABM33_00271 [Erwinia phage pEa_SNUABM_33]